MTAVATTDNASKRFSITNSLAAIDHAINHWHMLHPPPISYSFWRSLSLFSLSLSLSHSLSLRRSLGNVLTVWPDLAKIRHFCHILKAFGYFRSLHLALGISLSLLWHVFDAIGQIFIDISGQIFTNNLAIWSHCQYFVSIRLLLFLWVLDRILQI